MKLELKHIAPYLSYGLMIQYLENETFELVGFNRNTIYHTRGFFVELPGNLKPILRPLSDLTKEIEHNGEKFVPIDVIRSISETPYSSSFRFENGNFIFTEEKLENNYGLSSWVEYDFYAGNQYDLFQKLIEWHFDVFGLREKDLCIYYNEL